MNKIYYCIIFDKFNRLLRKKTKCYAEKAKAEIAGLKLLAQYKKNLKRDDLKVEILEKIKVY